MRALIVNDTGLIAIDDLSIPEGRGECLIRVRMAGICGTDLELLKGYADFRGIPGHEFVTPRGTVVMKSTVHGEAAVTTWPIVVNEVTLMGSRCGPFAAAIGLLSKGTVKVGPLVSRVFLLEGCGQAFDAARRGLKVLFDLRGL